MEGCLVVHSRKPEGQRKEMARGDRKEESQPDVRSERQCQMVVLVSGDIETYR